MLASDFSLYIILTGNIRLYLYIKKEISMKTFEHKVTDLIGIHARPASEIVDVANKFKSEIIIEANKKGANLKKLSEVLALRIAHTDTVEVSVDGEDEIVAAAALKAAFEEYL